ERQPVLFRRLGLHRDEEVDRLLAAELTPLTGADRVPRGQAGDVRREHVLPGGRNTHEEERSQEDHVGSLTARPVDGGDLDAEIVYDALAAGGGSFFGDL